VSSNELLERLYQLAKEAAHLTDGPPIDVPFDPDLFLPDFLDSIGLTTLLTLIEEEWDVEFDDEEIEPELFESLETLSAAIAEKLSPRRSA
jgi:acyl carrier protein